LDTDDECVTVNSYADVAGSRKEANAKMRRLVEQAVESYYEGSGLGEEDIAEIVEEIISNSTSVAPEKAEVHSWEVGSDCYSWKITESVIPTADKA
jgi:hypothetical protein